MNCLEFRRLLGTEPKSRVADFLAHLGVCKGCAEAHARAQAQERAFERALSISPPAGLNERVLLRQLTAARSETSRVNRYRWLQVAAVVVLSVGGLAWWQINKNLNAFDLRLVDHLQHEAFATSVLTPVSKEQIDGAFRRVGLSPPADLGNVTFVALCSEDGKRFLHFVEQTPGGAYTVMITPDMRLPPRQIAHNEWVVRSTPIDTASLSVIGENASGLTDVQRRWMNAMRPSQEAVGSL